MKRERVSYPVSHWPFRRRAFMSPMRRWMSQWDPTVEPDYYVVEEDVDWVPTMNLVDLGEKLVLEVDLPGVRKEDIRITLEDNMLWIRGERRIEERKDESYYCCERPSGTFSRRVQLPYRVQDDQIETSLSDGVLTITLPKAKELRPREVSIR